MSAAEKLQEREASKRAELEQRLRDLRARREQAVLDLQAARDALLEDPSDAAKQACAAAESLVHALDSKLTAYDRDLRKLNAFGDDDERKKFREQLDKMCSASGKRRDQNRVRVEQLGRDAARMLLAVLDELAELTEAERQDYENARSLAAYLDPTLTAQDLAALGARFAGISGARGVFRRSLLDAAKVANVSQSDLRILLDL